MTAVLPLCLFLLFVPSIFTQFVSEDICTTNGCNLVCASTTIPLVNIVSTNGGSTQRVFQLSSTDSYRYVFVIPLCGSSSNSYNLPWQSGQVWQIQQGQNSQQYNLGLYNSATWRRGLYDDSEALSVTYVNGDYCNTAFPYGLQTTVYLVCNRLYSVSAPLIVAKEDSICTYSITVSLRDMCSSDLPPTYSPARIAPPTLFPSAVPTRRPTEPDEHAHGVLHRTEPASPVEIIIGTVVSMIGLVGLLSSCYWFMRHRKHRSSLSRVYAEVSFAHVPETVHTTAEVVVLPSSAVSRSHAAETSRTSRGEEESLGRRHAPPGQQRASVNMPSIPPSNNTGASSNANDNSSNHGRDSNGRTSEAVAARRTQTNNSTRTFNNINNSLSGPTAAVEIPTVYVDCEAALETASVVSAVPAVAVLTTPNHSHIVTATAVVVSESDFRNNIR